MAKIGFYNLSKPEREKLVQKMEQEILSDVEKTRTENLEKYNSDEDTYIRKSAYLALGKFYKNNKGQRKNIWKIIDKLIKHSNEKIRQTVVYVLGEIGKTEDVGQVFSYFDDNLKDAHHSVRNAVIGSLKIIGQKNPKPALKFARKYLHHTDSEIRREIIHGIELRGRTHPEDVLPLLEELQNDENKRVRETLIHVVGQISYKKGCLHKVLTNLTKWSNQDIVKSICEEIINVHKNYERFSEKSVKEAKSMIKEIFK
jgi:HEAT repeat protein